MASDVSSDFEEIEAPSCPEDLIADSEYNTSVLIQNQEAELSSEPGLLVLESLWDFVKHLPSFTLQPSSGYCYVEGNLDEEVLYGFTRHIGELTLGTESPEDKSFSLHLLVRVARFHSSARPLFLNLYFLQITASSKFLDFLDLFLPSSLSTLELIAISDDDPHYSSVLAFLKSAIVESCLTTLTLGPGQIQDQVLNLALMNRNLRCLCLLDVDVSITDDSLRIIGSLQHLETFVLRTRETSTVKLSVRTPTRDVDGQFVGFPALRTLEFEGNLRLIITLLANVNQSGYQSLLVDLSIPTQSVSISHKQDQTDNRPTGVISIQRLNCEPIPSVLKLSISNMVLTILRRSSLHIKTLDVTGINLDFLGSKLGLVRLEILHLPVHPTAGIPLSQLRDIALSCPNLKSLRCRFCFLHIPCGLVPPLFHPLEVLSVRTSVTQQASLETARFIDSIFPNIKTIQMHDKDLKLPSDWDLIRNVLMNVCQKVRDDVLAMVYLPKWLKYERYRYNSQFHQCLNCLIQGNSLPKSIVCIIRSMMTPASEE